MTAPTPRGSNRPQRSRLAATGSGRPPAPRAVTLATVAASLVAVGAACSTSHRLMIGESIRVEQDEVLAQVTCIACSIQVDGVVTDTAVLVLGRLAIRGEVRGTATVVGGTLESSGEIGGDSVVIAGNMRLLGSVGGDAIAVLGNIQADAPDLRVDGSVFTVMGRAIGLSPSSVGGTVEQVGEERLGQLVLSGVLIALLILAVVLLALLAGLNIVAYLVLGSERVETIGHSLNGSPAACFLGGLATCFALFVIGLVVAVLLPVSLPIMLVFLAVSVAGYSGLSYSIGRNLLPKWSPFASTVAASAIIIVIQLIPVVGWLVMLVLWNIAIGAAVLSGFGTSKDWLVSRAEGGAWRRGPVR